MADEDDGLTVILLSPLLRAAGRSSSGGRAFRYIDEGRKTEYFVVRSASLERKRRH